MYVSREGSDELFARLKAEGNKFALDLAVFKKKKQQTAGKSDGGHGQVEAGTNNQRRRVYIPANR
jgi:hypothetical protein